MNHILFFLYFCHILIRISPMGYMANTRDIDYLILLLIALYYF